MISFFVDNPRPKLNEPIRRHVYRLYNLDDNDVRSEVYIYNLFISNNVFF